MALAMLALSLRLLVAPGYMPGSSLAQPIAICAGQSGAIDGSDHAPTHRHAGHDCPFAGMGAAPAAPPPPLVLAWPLQASDQHAAAPLGWPGVVPGLAAPPPPSHAPPVAAA